MTTRSLPIAELTPDLIWGEAVEVVTPTEKFLMRRVGPADKRHHYQVWHAFLWGQQELTGTQWRICVNFESAINLMNRHSDDQDT